jgi:hypothetical protein
MPPKSRGLERQHLIVTEGRDDQIVVESLAAREGASHVQVMHCQGRDNLENKIRAVAAESGFRSLVSLGIVLDAEESAAATQTSIEAALKAAGLGSGTDQPRVRMHVVQRPDGKGMMEDICLASLSGRPVMECVDAYLICCNERGQTDPANSSKARFQAWLSSQPLKSGQWYFLGTAIESDLLDLGHPAFDPLRAFVRAVAEM